MKTAIVTGASKGIGLAITKRLLTQGYKVYGIARTYDNHALSHENFVALSFDLANTEDILKAADHIKKNEKAIHLLVNNAGQGCFGPHEQLNITDLSSMIRVNLEAPILLTRLFLRELKQSGGMLLAISSVTAKKPSPHGCAYAATKAGLTHFYTSLFEEVRKAGVKVTTLHPDMTKSGFYDTLDFTCDDDECAFLLPEQVADAAEYALNTGKHLVASDITIKPQKNKIKRKHP